MKKMMDAYYIYIFLCSLKSGNLWTKESLEKTYR